MKDTKLIDTIFGRFSQDTKGRLDLTYDYETAAIRTFRETTAHISAETVVDIGANVGVYSIYTSNITSVKRVEAFEPAPEAYRLLQESIDLQDNAKIFHAHNIALSESPGEVSFGIVGPTAGNNRIVSSDDATVSKIKVRAERLDNVLDMSGETISLKIDVEGHETSVIAGGENFFKNNNFFVQIECLREKSFRSVRNLLATHNIRHVFSIHHDHLFISSTLQNYREEIMNIVQRNLSLDLADLTTLRVEKRKTAAEAKRLWLAAGYKRDPLLP